MWCPAGGHWSGKSCNQAAVVKYGSDTVVSIGRNVTINGQELTTTTKSVGDLEIFQSPVGRRTVTIRMPSVLTDQFRIKLSTIDSVKAVGFGMETGYL